MIGCCQNGVTLIGIFWIIGLSLQGTVLNMIYSVFNVVKYNSDDVTLEVLVYLWGCLVLWYFSGSVMSFSVILEFT